MTEETKQEAHSPEAHPSEEAPATQKPLEKPVDTIHDLFEERDRTNQDFPNRDRSDQDFPNRDCPRSEEVSKVESLKKEPFKKKQEAAEPKNTNGDIEEEETSRTTLAEVYALRQKLEVAEKRLAENQKYGRESARKLKNVLKTTQKLTDDGLLAEEEAKELLEIIHSDVEDIPEDVFEDPSRPFDKIFRIANKEFQNILKYTDDDRLEDKVKAFDYFLSISSKEEIEEVLEELTELVGDPVKLAKKMLSIGQAALDESYSEIQQTGGFKNYIAKKNGDIEKLQKKIDKLEKKLSQYEDYDKPRFRIDELSETEGEKPSRDTISSLFDERDKVVRR